MNIAEVIPAAVATLVPYLKKGGEELLKGAGKELWDWTKSLFKDKKEEAQLEQFEQKPDDPKLQGKIELLLENLVAENDTLKTQLQQLIEKVQKETGGTVNTANIDNSSKFVAGNNFQSGGDNNITIS